MTDFTDVSQESAREAVANVAMTIRAMATGLQLRSEFDGSMGQSLNSVANECLEWASRLERAVKRMDEEKSPPDIETIRSDEAVRDAFVECYTLQSIITEGGMNVTAHQIAEWDRVESDLIRAILKLGAVPPAEQDTPQ